MKLTFSSPVATAEFSKFAGILSAALSQHHLLAFEIAQLEFHHLQHRRPGFDPGSGRSLGGGDGYRLQCSCLENPMDSRTWWATVHGVTKKLDVTKHTSLVAQLVRNLPAMP